MESKAKQIGLFLLTGLVVLTIAIIYSLPMQQATACGNGCGGSGDDCCGGSLISVDDNNIGNNIGNINTGHILSGNEIKALNDVNVLSKNYLKDVNVLSKNYNNLKVSDVVSDNVKDITIKSNDVIEDHSNVLVVDDNIKKAFNILLGH